MRVAVRRVQQKYPSSAVIKAPTIMPPKTVAPRATPESNSELLAEGVVHVSPSSGVWVMERSAGEVSSK